MGPNDERDERDQEIHEYLLENEPDYYGETLDLRDVESPD